MMSSQKMYGKGIVSPFNPGHWLSHIDCQSDASWEDRNQLYEIALNFFPDNGKIWHGYLSEWLNHLLPLKDPSHISKLTNMFNGALEILPESQSNCIWLLYLSLASRTCIPSDISIDIHRRYLLFNPSHIEDFIEVLLSFKVWQEAAERLAHLLNDNSFISRKKKSRQHLWLELCNLLTDHAFDISNLNLDDIILNGLLVHTYSDDTSGTDKIGRLWTSLADYYIHRGLYLKASDVFRKGLANVTSIKDFSFILDACDRFERTAEFKTIDRAPLTDYKEFLLKNYENAYKPEVFNLIIIGKPMLVNSLLLTQNPHVVEEWLRRVSLFGSFPNKQILAFTEALKAVDPIKAEGMPYTLWVAFARFYEDHNDLAKAREIFGKAVEANYKDIINLENVWCEWGEMEVRQGNILVAFDLMRQSTTEPSFEVNARAKMTENVSVQLRLHKSLRLWCFYVELEEKFGTLEGTRAVYEKILDLKIATPKIILNYALFLEKHNYFEDAFKVYQRGIRVFNYPDVIDIWVTYLSKFVQMYGYTQLEMIRELFEEAIKNAPTLNVKQLYLQYAKFEEDYGLRSRMINVYDRALKAVPFHEKLNVFEIYTARALENFSISRARIIHEYVSLVNPSLSVDRAIIGDSYESFAIYCFGRYLVACLAKMTENVSVQLRLHKLLRLWCFYVELEEKFGTLEGTRAVYEKILDLKIATPKIILNYALFLEKHNYFEDAFKVYQRGIRVFNYPDSIDIWITYLSKFVQMYGYTQLEMIRELFEEAIKNASAQNVKKLYLQYAKFEEDYGLRSRMINVYDRALKAVPFHEKLNVFEIYTARALEDFNISRARIIHEAHQNSNLLFLPPIYQLIRSINLLNFEECPKCRCGASCASNKATSSVAPALVSDS